VHPEAKIVAILSMRSGVGCMGGLGERLSNFALIEGPPA
jgi:hypothetical protein